MIRIRANLFCLPQRNNKTVKNIENMIRIEIVLTLPYSEANISLLVLSHPSVIKNCLEHPNLNAVMYGMG